MRISYTKLDFLLGDGAATLTRVVKISMGIALGWQPGMLMVVSKGHGQSVPH